MRAWHVSDEVFHGDDGELVTTNELALLQEELRKKYGIDSTLIEKYRFAHLGQQEDPSRASAVRCPAAPCRTLSEHDTA